MKNENKLEKLRTEFANKIALVADERSLTSDEFDGVINAHWEIEQHLLKVISSANNELYSIACETEKLPASEQQTKVITLVSALRRSLAEYGLRGAD